MTKLIKIRAKEFARKILEGEKEFRYVKLPTGEDLGRDALDEVIDAVRKYLHLNAVNFKSNPINVEGSKFRGVGMMGLELPFLHAVNADFEGATFYGMELYKANLQGANFTMAQFPETCLENANFNGANLRYADLSGAWTRMISLRYTNLSDTILDSCDLRGADFDGANVRKTNLERACLFAAVHIDRTIDTHLARLDGAAITPKEKELLESHYPGKLWNVRGDDTLSAMAFIDRFVYKKHDARHKSYEGIT